MECVYAIGVPGFTIRNSTFRDCAIMDLFFTYGNWWSPLPPSYGNVTIENNVFAHAEMENNGGWHYYSLYVGSIGPNGPADPMNGWVVRNNTFEQTAPIAPASATGGTRWVGNLGDWELQAGLPTATTSARSAAPPTRRSAPRPAARARTAALGWVNPGAYDFHLTPGSPAINAGDPNDFPRSTAKASSATAVRTQARTSTGRGRQARAEIRERASRPARSGACASARSAQSG